MKRPILIIIALLICVATPIHSVVAGDAMAGKVKAQLCAACHGAGGRCPVILRHNWPYLSQVAVLTQ